MPHHSSFPTCEYWDLYDSAGQSLGRRIARGDLLHPGEYHLVVQVWVVRQDGAYLIQQRADNGLWATTAGCVVAGETAQQAAMRELAEELGLSANTAAFALRYQDRSSFALGSAWQLAWEQTNQRMQLQHTEVQDVMWASPAQIAQMVRAGRFYDYGNSYFESIFVTA